MRSPPIGVRSSTVPGCSSVTCPIRTASRPSGCARIAARTALGVPGGNEGDELALVRDEQRVEPEDLARAAHGVAHRDGALVDLDADALARRDLDQGGGDPAARGVAHGVDARAAPRARRPRARGAAPCRSRSRPSNSSPSRCERMATPWSPIGPESSTTSPGRTLRDDRSTPGGTMPMPEVLMKILSPLPRPTTFVSPVTIRTPARSAACRADSTTRRRSPSGQPLLEDEGERQRERLRAADGEVVHRAVHGQLADVAAGEEDRA